MPNRYLNLRVAKHFEALANDLKNGDIDAGTYNYNDVTPHNDSNIEAEGNLTVQFIHMKPGHDVDEATNNTNDDADFTTTSNENNNTENDDFTANTETSQSQDTTVNDEESNLNQPAFSVNSDESSSTSAFTASKKHKFDQN